MSNETYLQSAAMSRDDLQAVIRRHLTAENAHDLDGTLDTLASAIACFAITPPVRSGMAGRAPPIITGNGGTPSI